MIGPNSHPHPRLGTTRGRTVESAEFFIPSRNAFQPAREAPPGAALAWFGQTNRVQKIMRPYPEAVVQRPRP